MKSYPRGSLVRESFEFRQESDFTLHDPTDVFFSYKIEFDGTPTVLHFGVDAGLVKDAVGQYHVDINGSIAGIYYMKAYSTGTGQAAQERQFEIQSNFL